MLPTSCLAYSHPRISAHDTFLKKLLLPASVNTFSTVTSTLDLPLPSPLHSKYLETRLCFDVLQQYTSKIANTYLFNLG